MTYLFRMANGEEIRLEIAPDTRVDQASELLAHRLGLPRNSNLTLYYNSYRLSPRWTFGDLGIEEESETPIFVRVSQGGGALSSGGFRHQPSPVPRGFLALVDQLGLTGQYPEELMLQALRQAHDEYNAAITVLMDGQMSPDPQQLAWPSREPFAPPPPRAAADPLDQLLAQFPGADPGFVRDVFVGAQRNIDAARALLAQLHGS
jgi:hypothetical protein